MNKWFFGKYLFLILNLLIMGSCNREDFASVGVKEFRVSTEVLTLKSDSTAIAGTIEISADVPEVEVEWITTPHCKLNTHLTKLYLEDGKTVLPIEWLKPFENGEEYLAGLSFNAEVKITAGKETKHVSLLWGKDGNTSIHEIMKGMTRNENDVKAADITVSPQSVNMNYQTGGAIFVTLTNVASAIVEYSNITPSMNIDLASLPTVLTQSDVLLFKWKGSAPTTSFKATVTIYGQGVPPVHFDVNYTASDNPGPGPGPDPSDDLKVSTVVPAGNIPDEGGAYYCNFTGTFNGTVIYRATKDGVEIARTSGSVPSLLNVLIPEMSGGSTSAVIRFEYSKDGGNTWILIETRTQNQENLVIYPVEPSGHIPAGGATMKCAVYGTYSKKITVHARIGASIIASASGSVPSTLSLQIPANTATSNQLIYFEYSRNGGPWRTLEVRRQLAN